MSDELDPRAAGARRLKDKVCIVTGAGQGIGRAAAKRLGQEGGKIVVADRVEPAAEQTVGELRQHGVDAASAIVDLGAFEAARKLMALAVERFGRIDVLVNNVGGTIWIKPFHLYTEQQVHLELERSLLPTLWCCLAVLPVMMKQQAGSIVNIGSHSPRGIYRLPYAASKGAVLAMTKVLSLEYGGHGIRVNAVSPGGTEISDHVTARGAGGRGSRGSQGLSALRARDEAGHREAKIDSSARFAGGAGGRHRIPRLRRCLLHYGTGHRLQRRAGLSGRLEP